MPVSEPGPSVDPAVLSLVAAARRDQRRMRFDYRTHDGTARRRGAGPHRLVRAG